MRERLIELLIDAEREHLNYEMANKFCPFDGYKCHSEYIADHLIENGVVLLPCKVEDTIYTISSGLVKEHKIEKIEITRSKIYLLFDWHGMGYEIADLDLIGKTVFLSQEAAEMALKGGE